MKGKRKKIFAACLATTMAFSTVTAAYAGEVLTKEDTGIVQYADPESMDSGASQNNGDTPQVSEQANYHLTAAVEDDQLILRLNFVGGSAVAAGNYTIDYDTEVFSLVSVKKGAVSPNQNIDTATADGLDSDGLLVADTSDQDLPLKMMNFVNGALEGFIHGSFAYTDGYQSGSTELAVITLKMKKGSFDKDDIAFSRSNLFDVEGNKIADLDSVTPVVDVIYEEGWQQSDNGWWYQYEDGTFPKNEWKKIEGKWYYFGEDGIMKKGWLSLENKWYYLNAEGSMTVSTWKQIGGKWLEADRRKVVLFRSGWHYEDRLAVTGE